MSRLRKDPISGGWVIVADDRMRRPPDYDPVPLPAQGETKFCPFCEGNESATPNEIYAVRDEGSPRNGPGWKVRVVPNKFAALRIEGELERLGDGIYDMMSGIGAHEVVIETPDNNLRMGEFSQEHMELVISAYRARVLDLHRDTRFKYVQIFRNYGKAAGAQQDHPHSQIIALPITPRWVKEELVNCREHYEYKERCLFCDIINQERKDRSRIVFENEEFMAFEPFASKFPFETWILPKVHNHDFRYLSDQQIPHLAEALRRTLLGLQIALNNPPYNFVIHSAPRAEAMRGGQNIERDYHWHIEIIPRITKMAGFEWGTGFYINPTLPEDAADFLRKSIADNPEPPSRG